MHSQDHHEREEEAVKQCCDFGAGGHGTDGLTERGVVQREEDTVHEVSVSCSVRREADGPVPTEEEQGGAKDVPRNLDQHLRGEERSPRVHSTGTFADLVDRAQIEEGNLELVGERNAHDRAHVDRLLR